MSERLRARLYVDADLAPGASVSLNANQAHYLQHVMRFKAGEGVALFNGRDGEWRARVEGVGKVWGEAVVEARRREQAPEPDVWSLFAPLKRGRLDFLVQKVVELGASALRPVITEHTNNDRINTERLRANVIEAAEQCERLTVPDVAVPVKLRALGDGWPDDRELLVCAEAGRASPLLDVLCAERPRPKAALLTGPEGGFANYELDLLNEFPFVTCVSLGPRILRAETAALAALSCYQAALGDWRTRPRTDQS